MRSFFSNRMWRGSPDPAQAGGNADQIAGAVGVDLVEDVPSTLMR